MLTWIGDWSDALETNEEPKLPIRGHERQWPIVEGIRRAKATKVGFDRIPPTLGLTMVGGRVHSNRDKGLGLGYIVGLGFP